MMASQRWRTTRPFPVVATVLATAVLAGAACHDAPRSGVDPTRREPDSADRGASAATPGARTVDAGPRTWPSDAPSRDACHTHAECTVVVWDGPMPPDPCCDQRVGYLAVSRAYLSFMERYRKASCAGVTCPVPPLPGAEPACCANIGRCVAQHCVSACEDPTAHAPAISVLDPGCNVPIPSDPEPCDPAATPKAYAGGAASPAYAQLTKCCATVRFNVPMLTYGPPYELTEAADRCDELAARLANGCAPTRLAELKQQLRGKGIPGCKLP